jgi:hypothetical protein
MRWQILNAGLLVVGKITMKEEKMMKGIKKNKFLFCVLIFGLIMIFAAPALIGAEQKIKQKAIDCTYAVEKGKDGKETYTLQGKDCKDYVAQMKPQTKAKGRGMGTSCEGSCNCTWYDNCNCFICRGCCSDLFRLSQR